MDDDIPRNPYGDTDFSRPQGFDEKRDGVDYGYMNDRVIYYSSTIGKDKMCGVLLPAGYDEKELEDALEQNITRFLLELGSGFAFIGRQKEIIVAGKTRKIDMLFYHIKLRCYVVVELKAVSFEPEFAGKLNFYVNAVNQLMKTDDDNPTIGLLICKDKDQTEVQWAFQGIETPMGVATYDNIRMNEIKSQLPSEEAIQKRLEQAEEEYLLKLQEKFK